MKKYHQGIPLYAVITDVFLSNILAISFTIPGIEYALSVINIKSILLNFSIESVHFGKQEISFSSSIKVSPFLCIASKWAPLATSDTSKPALINLTPKYPPIAPAPTIQIFIFLIPIF